MDLIELAPGAMIYMDRESEGGWSMVLMRMRNPHTTIQDTRWGNRLPRRKQKPRYARGTLRQQNP
jgi:hypothetical protein